MVEFVKVWRLTV